MSHTPEPWYKPHICNDDHSCDCRSIVCESYAGSIAEIIVNNGLPISEGGNDAPPKEEAAANAARIVDCVNAMAGIDDPVGLMRELRDVLGDVAAHLDRYADVRDGDYGCPEANKEMALLGPVEQLLSRMGDA